MHSNRITLRLCAAVAALTLAAPAFAAGQVAQTVTKDPVTGKLRNPTAVEAKELADLRAADLAARKAARKAAGAPEAGVVRLQGNGVKAIHLDEDSVMYSVMHRTADGKLELNCVHGETAALDSVNTNSKEHQHDVE